MQHAYHSMAKCALHNYKHTHRYFEWHFYRHSKYRKVFNYIIYLRDSKGTHKLQLTAFDMKLTCLCLPLCNFNLFSFMYCPHICVTGDFQ